MFPVQTYVIPAPLHIWENESAFWAWMHVNLLNEDLQNKSSSALSLSDSLAKLV